MLNGQLPLTALYFPRASFARLGRPAARIAGALGIGLICGCTSTSLSRAPVVDLSSQPAGSVTPAGGSYVVKPGDTLYQIARSNGVSVDSLKQWNNIGDAEHDNAPCDHDAPAVQQHDYAGGVVDAYASACFGCQPDHLGLARQRCRDADLYHGDQGDRYRGLAG